LFLPKARKKSLLTIWEPRDSAVSFPHIHIGFGARDAQPPFDPKCHIPSGRVPIEDVVCMLINEMGVVPVKQKWEDIITNARGAFMRHKSW
jgi:hypothetical protein